MCLVTAPGQTSYSVFNVPVHSIKKALGYFSYSFRMSLYLIFPVLTKFIGLESRRYQAESSKLVAKKQAGKEAIAWDQSPQAFPVTSHHPSW